MKTKGRVLVEWNAQEELGGIVDEARTQLAAGLSLDDLIIQLRTRGLAIVPSMYVVAKACNLSLRDTKLRVTAHPIWAKVVEANEPLHDELEQMLLDWQKESGNGSK